jgi:16S rRNA (guanine527-N7)-methyltransferase
LSSGDFRDRFFARAAHARVVVTPAEFEQLEAYYRLLTRWNRTINLTAFRLEPPGDASVDRLFIEPLAAAAYLPQASGRWIDLGSGGGSPAIPLKVVRPQLALTMVEARERKASFLREVVRQMALPDVAVVTGRFETLRTQSDCAGAYTAVTVRAVRTDRNLLSLARWLLAGGGQLFLFGPLAVPIDTAQFSNMQTVQLGPERSSTLVVLTAGT